MQVFDCREKNNILKQLQERHPCLCDNTIMNVLYLLRQLRATQPVQVIDSHNIARLSKDERICLTIKHSLYHSGSTGIILFPIHDCDHWSLLFFLPSLRCYAHLDSIALYHHCYVQRLLLFLAPTQEENTLPYTRLLLPQEPQCQDSNWECGFFLLMNAFMVIDAKETDLENTEQYCLYLSRHMASIKESNVCRFARKLRDIISEL